MKRFYKINTALAATLFVLSLLTGCFFGNSSDSNSGNNGASGSGTKGTSVELQGLFTVPADLSTASRSATATLPTGWTYFVSAETTDGSLTATGTVNASAKTFTINLRTGYTWSILVGIKDSSSNIILSDSYEKELTSTDTLLNHTFNLVPHKGGTGSVELSIFCDSAYTITVESTPYADFDVLGSGAEKTLKATNISSGTYSLLLKFSKSGVDFTFTTTQTISVFDHLTTNKWHSGGNALINADGKFELTDDLFNLAKDNKTEFYVDNNNSVGDDSYSGNYTAPLATISKALALINALGSDDKTYTVHVKDTPDADIWTSTITITKNVAIEVYKNKPGDGLGFATVTRNTGGQHGLLVVDGGKTLSLTGIDFLGQNIGGTGYGTAISVINNSTLTLNSGTIMSFQIGIALNSGVLNLYGGDITSNSTGIFNSQQTINIKGTPAVYNNVDSNTGNTFNLLLDNTCPKLQITGPFSADADIHITGLALPSGTSSYAFTEGFTTNSPGVYAQQVFTSDTSGCAVTKLTSGTYAGEAAIALNGGSIALEDIKENISIKIDKTKISDTYLENVFTFTVIKDFGLATQEDITNQSKVSYSYIITNNGTVVPDTNDKYYSANRNVVSFTSALSLDTYKIHIVVTYNGRTYQGDFSLSTIESVSSLTEAPTTGTYSVSSVDELTKLKDWITAGSTLEGVTFKLTQDVEISTPGIMIGSWRYDNSDFKAFSGVFDGDGHTITNNHENLTWSTKRQFGGLFPYVKGNSAVIRNLTVDGVSDRNSIAGYVEDGVTIENCISKTTITCTDNSDCDVGGIAGHLHGGSVRNCINIGNMSSPRQSQSMGGIIGSCNSPTVEGCIERCINKGNITKSYGGQSGGIVGYFSSSKIPIRNCKNYGNISNTSSSSYIGDVGGICGFSDWVSEDFIQNNCNFGTISVTDASSSAGGLIGDVSRVLNFENNCNSGTARYGAIGSFGSAVETSTAAGNYSLAGTYNALLFPSTGGKESFNPNTAITSAQISVFTASESDTVIENLNNWAQANSTDTIQYAGWKKNANNLPELDLGDLDTLADSL